MRFEHTFRILVMRQRIRGNTTANTQLAMAIFQHNGPNRYVKHCPAHQWRRKIADRPRIYATRPSL